LPREIHCKSQFFRSLLEARAQHDAALAEYQAAREKLRLLIPMSDIRTLQWSDNGHPLSQFSLSSPIEGTLVKRDLSLGQMIDRGGSAPFTIINLDRVWIVANVFEHDLADLKTGDEVNVTVDAYSSKIFAGHVTYITTRSIAPRARYGRGSKFPIPIIC
jgi:cobalt-zinc-cadmium efflux system membrane fusion protein